MWFEFTVTIAGTNRLVSDWPLGWIPSYTGFHSPCSFPKSHTKCYKVYSWPKTGLTTRYRGTAKPLCCTSELPFKLSTLLLRQTINCSFLWANLNYLAVFPFNILPCPTLEDEWVHNHHRLRDEIGGSLLFPSETREPPVQQQLVWEILFTTSKLFHKNKSFIFLIKKSKS